LLRITFDWRPNERAMVAYLGEKISELVQMWDFPNVFVVGASAFPQNPGYNPTGTVGALAYRAADGIVNRYRARPGLLV